MHALARSRLLSGLLAVFVSACASSAGTTNPPHPAPPAPTSAAESGTVAPTTRQTLDAFVDEWLERAPSRGRQLGLHQYDGKLADYSAAAIASKIRWLEAAEARLSKLDTASDADLALDKALAVSALRMELFNLKERDEWRKNPLFYAELFSVNDYLDRDYAPLAKRAEKLLEHEEAALEQMPRVRENLRAPLPKPLTETAIKLYRGYAEYLRGDVEKQLAGVGGPEFRRRFTKANAALATAAEAIAEGLKQDELPKADQGYVLGVERYRKLLFAQEGLSLPLSELKTMAERDLAKNQAAYAALAKSTKLVRPPADKVFAEARELVERSRAFVVEKDLVSVPAAEHLKVEETPPYMRWNQAFLNPPGAFESAETDAFYYITLPDKSWPKKEQNEYLLPRGVLLATTVHEVYPGHYLQGLWLNRAPTKAQKVFESYSFVEGWAHYGEQLMIEEGFAKDDPQGRLGQLSDALLRNCRFVVSIALHTEGLSLDAAAKRFENDCHQDAASAREQAVRGSFDPGYFAYTLGKLQILALRERVKQALGPKFSLRRFHDALLSHGSPPIPLIEARVLAELTR